MYSKIKFDLSEDNQPIVLIEQSPSDDVRDKIAGRFTEYNSNWLRIVRLPKLEGTNTKDYMVTPIRDEEIAEQCELMMIALSQVEVSKEHKEKQLALIEEFKTLFNPPRNGVSQ